MSLMKTLAKVAIGVAVVKGVGAVMKNREGGTAAEGGLFGGPHSPGGDPAAREAAIGERMASGGAQGEGLGGLLDRLRSQGATSAKAAGNANANASSEGFGAAFNQSVRTGAEPATAPSADQEAMAALMLRAMLQAAKSDGQIDDAERDKLLARLGDISADERDFINREMRAPVSIEALVRDVPRGAEAQVYAMSVLGIDLDSQAEAQYLHSLATGLGLDRTLVNDIHDQLGVPKIYQ